MKKATLVIAKHKENIDWIYSITNPDIDIVIIDKGGKKIQIKSLINNNFTKIIYLKNIGRETYSFIYYISTFYNRLQNYTIFSQGNPFDHYSNMLNFINKKEYNKFLPLSDKGVIITETNEATEKLFRLLVEYPQNQKPSDYGAKLKYTGFHFPTGAQYCVPKNFILNRPRIFWQSLISDLKWKENDQIPYLFERFFYMLYDPYYKINPNYFSKIGYVT